MREMRTIRTRSGRKVESPYADDEARAKLRELVAGRLSHDEFARRLAGSRNLTTEQRRWVHVLVVDAEATMTFEEATDEPMRPQATMLRNTVALLRKGRESGLRWPKVRMSGITVKFAGPRSRHAGKLIVHGSSWKDFYGVIEHDGAFRPMANLDPKVLAMLRAFEEDPTSVGMLLGIRSGSCCFCGRMLTTPESCGVGYGPVCARKFGLPWGPDTVEARMEKVKRMAARLKELQLDGLVIEVNQEAKP